MRKNHMGTNKKSNSIAALLFFALFISCPQLSYAEDKVHPLDSMNQVEKSDAKVKMLAMGIRKLESGQYQISLLLQNDKPLQGFITLDPDYIVNLIDIEGKEHRVNIDGKQTNYPDECLNGILSKSMCLVTVIGEVEDEDIKREYKSYSVTLPYSDEVTHDDRSPTFKEDIQDIVVDHSLEMTSSSSGIFALHVKNTSRDKIVIKDAALKSKCISLDNKIVDMSLAAGKNGNIRFQISSVGMPEIGDCDESISITYQAGNDKTKLKTVLIPIKISRTGPWYSWNNYGWMIATGAVATVVIVGGVGVLYVFWYLPAANAAAAANVAAAANANAVVAANAAAQAVLNGIVDAIRNIGWRHGALVDNNAQGVGPRVGARDSINAAINALNLAVPGANLNPLL